jgi:membrane fusion protein (multidrug efflux system)
LTNVANDAILIPQKSVFEIQDKNFVYVVDNNNKIATRSFTPKSRLKNAYVLSSGLEAGETIVYEGIQGLKDGATIAPKVINLDAPQPESTPAPENGK